MMKRLLLCVASLPVLLSGQQPSVQGPLNLDSPKSSSTPQVKKTSDPISEREHFVRLWKATAIMLDPKTSFIGRARTYCRSQTPATGWSDQSLDDLLAFYQHLLDQPDRPDPYLLLAIKQQIYTGYTNIDICQKEIVNYGAPLPTSDVEQHMMTEYKLRIIELDREIATQKEGKP
jgi:hypothetical protein